MKALPKTLGCRNEEPSRFGRALNFEFLILGAMLTVALAGCNRGIPEGALVVTQAPMNAPENDAGHSVLDERYPDGTRVVLVLAGAKPDEVRVMSKGLLAAGGPVASPNGKRVFFSGKALSGHWQVYEANLGGRKPKVVTAMEGGAMDPALIGNDEILFSSPVPKIGEMWSSEAVPALHAQRLGEAPRRLTFGTSGAVDPTVLKDGKILFVSAWSSSARAPSLGLFTINRDGTEVTPFALNRDGAPFVQRPRELDNGELAFVAGATAERGGDAWIESVQMARPFASRAPLFRSPASRYRSVEESGEGRILVCAQPGGFDGPSKAGPFGVMEMKSGREAEGEPVFDDSAWNEIEAIRLAARPDPMGHISSMNPAKNNGTLLCLDVNFSRDGGSGEMSSKATRVRILTGGAREKRTLGEIELQEDGSFMAEVPADTPLGFETLDAEGRVLHRLDPSIWVRPGENRACLGCHESHNRSPRNVRPMAVSAPVANLAEETKQMAQKSR